MTVSANAVIHFTKSLDNLKGILADNFKLAYCHEQHVINEVSFGFYVPMVSFCDIPLGQIKDVLDSYGTYGIGLSKEWAASKGLNPVIYLENKSNFSKELDRFIFHLIDENTPIHDDFDSSKNSPLRTMAEICRYTKNYQGELIRSNGEVMQNYVYYNEREWRYVPSYESNAVPIIGSKNNLKLQSQLDAANESIENERLGFEPKNVKYLIVNSEKEILDLLKYVREIKGDKYSFNDVDLLSTRIFTSQQIREDL